MKDSCCFSIFCWIFQILVWAMLLWLIIAIAAGVKVVGPVAGLIVCYIGYIIIEFFSSTAKYLCNKTSAGGIYQKMGYIIDHIQCFNFIVNVIITK